MTIKMPIFYFSGTGNTWWVGKRLEEALNQKGIDAEALSIEKISSVEVAEKIQLADILGLGYPIYGSDAPLNMLEFIKALPQCSQPLPTLIYVTELAFSGDGASFLRGQLKKKGYDVHWAVEFKMPNNISLDLGSIVNSFLKLFKADLWTVNKKVEALAERVVSEKKWIQGSIPFINLGWVQRIPFRCTFSWMQRHTWTVDAEKCSGCEHCVRLCAAGNITLVEGLPRWAEHCIFCMRCFNFCPEQAILAYRKPFNYKAFGDLPYQGPVPEFKPELLMRKKR
jgi:flavodoxin/Pyruvate/2-oxoacid:ferredoxin oxidoreductase delta subunit